MSAQRLFTVIKKLSLSDELKVVVNNSSESSFPQNLLEIVDILNNVAATGSIPVEILLSLLKARYGLK